MLEGRELEAEAFEFELLDEAGNAVQTVKNAGDGKITFAALNFSLADAGEKAYTVREKNTGVSGIVYDETEHTVKLTITDKGDGTLKITDDIPEKGIVFTNYFVKTTYVEAVKQWTGDEAHREYRRDITFTLYQTGADGEKKAIGEAVTIKADAEGEELTAIWQDVPMQYLQDGKLKDYEYSVEETVQLKEGEKNAYASIISSKAPYTFTVENRFEYAQASVPAGLKTLMNGTLQGEDFAFELQDSNGKVIESVRNAKDGKITFSTLEYNLSDVADAVKAEDGTKQKVFTYTVAEVDDKDARYIFDTTEYLVKVTLKQDKAGKLSTEVALEKKTASGTEKAEALVFVNQVKTTSFTVTKVWEGGSGPIRLTLYRDGEKMEPQPVCERDGDVYTYRNLPQYKANGQAYVYSAKEKYVEGYLAIYLNEAPYEDESRMLYDGGTVINRKERVASFTVTVEWHGLSEGEEAPEAELILYCNGVATDIKTPKPNSRGEYRYYDLPDMVDGKKAEYTVVQVPVDGFVTRHELADGTENDYADNFGLIVNTKIPETGDRTMPMLWMTLLGMSGLVLLKLRRKAVR